MRFPFVRRSKLGALERELRRVLFEVVWPCRFTVLDPETFRDVPCPHRPFRSPAARDRHEENNHMEDS